MDVDSEEQSEWTGTNVVAVATNPMAYPYHAANVRFFDVSDDTQWRWIGAVSLGREPTDGMIRRIRLKGAKMYAATAGVGKGLQVVDLDAVRGAFDAATANGEQSAGFWQMQGGLNSTSGFAQEAITQTIVVPTPLPPPPEPGDPPPPPPMSQLWDLDILDTPVNGVTETLMVATGRSPLVLATETSGVLYNGDILDADGAILTSWGYAIGTGVVNGIPLAAVSAIGGATPASPQHVLAIVDLRNPVAPRALGMFGGSRHMAVSRNYQINKGLWEDGQLVELTELVSGAARQSDLRRLGCAGGVRISRCGRHRKSGQYAEGCARISQGPPAPTDR